MAGGIKLSGWKKLSLALDKGISKKLKIEVGKATLQNALLFRRELRKQLSLTDENAPLTEAFKKSGKPLVDRGDLKKSMTAVRVKWNLGFAGVMRTSAEYNVGAALHDGATIQVTESMRFMFKYLSLAAQGKMNPSNLSGRAAELWRRGKHVDWHGISPGTSAIKIPGRPFVVNTMKNADLLALIEANWAAAVARAMS